MCLIAFAWQTHPRFRLALIANRDEWHARPSAPAAWLDRQVFGGRDLVAGGGWLQLGRSQRLAAVTNVRQGRPEAAARSRGGLVAEFSAGAVGIDDYLRALASRATDYGRFNLLLWQDAQLQVASNVPDFASRRLDAGLYGLSNGRFDEPWPKLLRARAGLADWLDSAAATAATPRLQPLFELLADTRPAADHELPDTGVGRELERRLAPVFIHGAEYGTRCSSVVLIEHEGRAWFAERRYGANAQWQGDSLFSGPLRGDAVT